MTIPTITEYLGVVPDRREQSAEAFTQAAITWTDYQADTFIPSINTTVESMNLAVAAVDDNTALAEDAAATAASSANYQGDWFIGAAALKGQSWSHNGFLWRAKQNSAVEPTEGVFWLLINTAKTISTKTSESAQDFIDSFALEVFQSPTDGLTKVKTRTLLGSEVYEVRKVSDDSLATIYIDKEGSSPITQDGTSNVSGSDGVVEFYIDNGEFYLLNGAGRVDFSTIQRADKTLLNSGKDLESNNTDQYDQYKVNASNIYDVFIVYGQSNSVGYALNTPGRYPPLDGCDYWNGSAITPLIYTMRTSQNEASSGHAWVAFANEYTRLTGRRVLIVPCGQGGTRIEDMSKGTQLYSDMLDYATDAKAAIAAGGYTLGTVSVLFHQGETNQLDGTTRDAYQTLFDTLTSDMRNDIPALHFFNFTVGYPQNRNEVSIQAIQTAQRYLARNKARVFTAFDDCGKFTQANGLLNTFDGVHYTQRGYNLMGLKGAQEVARVTAAFDETYDLRTTVTDADMGLMGVLDMPDDQAWKQVSATAAVDSGAFALQDMQASTTNRISNIASVEVIGGGLRFNLSCRATKVLKLSAQINSVGQQQGFKVSVGNITTSGGLYYIDVVIRQDLEFIVKGDGQILKGPTGFVSSYFTNILNSSVSGDVVTVTHPASDYFGIATGYGGSSNDKFNVVAFASPSSTSKTVGFEASDTYKTALVQIPNCKIDPSDIIFEGLEISIDCIVAEFAE